MVLFWPGMVHHTTWAAPLPTWAAPATPPRAGLGNGLAKESRFVAEGWGRSRLFSSRLSHENSWKFPYFFVPHVFWSSCVAQLKNVLMVCCAKADINAKWYNSCSRGERLATNLQTSDPRCSTTSKKTDWNFEVLSKQPQKVCQAYICRHLKNMAVFFSSFFKNWISNLKIGDSKGAPAKVRTSGKILLLAPSLAAKMSCAPACRSWDGSSRRRWANWEKLGGTGWRFYDVLCFVFCLSTIWATNKHRCRQFF